jgi:hypothetical protein
MAWIRTTIDINEELGPLERQAVATEVIDKIIERTRERNIDKNGRKLPGYSKSYRNSDDFKIAGKSAGSVDLTLTGDMLDSLKLLSHRKGKIVIGFDKDDTVNNGKAEGNIKGTYGQSKPIPGKQRDFLGLPKTEILSIESRYIPNSRNAEEVQRRIDLMRELLDAEQTQS